MNILVLKKFNNYFNRKLIKYSTLADYKDASSSYKEVLNVNFNPNDGVHTELVLGQGQIGDFFDFEKTDTADYLICYTISGTEVDPVLNIESRWFITEVQRTRVGQYSFILKRDSLVDNFNSLLSCPAYIEKGMLSDDDPYILNSEGVTFNEIKSDEQLLKDNTNSAWVVCYCGKKDASSEINLQCSSAQLDDAYTTLNDIATELGITESQVESIVNGGELGHAYTGSFTFGSWYNFKDSTSSEVEYWGTVDNNIENDNGNAKTVWNSSASSKATFAGSRPMNNLEWVAGGIEFGRLIAAASSSVKAAWPSIFGAGHYYVSEAAWNYLNNLVNNKTIIYTNGSYYYLVFDSAKAEEKTIEVSTAVSPWTSIFNDLNTYMLDHFSFSISNWENRSGTTGKMYVKANEIEFGCHLELVQDVSELNNISLKITTTKNPVEDQVFDMFVMPYNGVQVRKGLRDYQYCTGEYSQKLAQNYATKEDKNCYDVQLLPYFPWPELIDAEDNLDIRNLTEHYDYDWITKRGGIGFDQTIKTCSWFDSRSAAYTYGELDGHGLSDVADYGYEILEGQEYITGDIDFSAVNIGGEAVYFEFYAPCLEANANKINVRIWWKWNAGNDEVFQQSIVFYPKKATFSTLLNKSLSLKDEMKVESQCNHYRLCSPNYQGSFDFNVAKNGGYVSNFIAECTYKPYTPYIKVAPAFNWMYGTNYGDARGLICGGDFSLGIITDAWKSYELQNKNYQNIFNREIQNLSTNQNIAYEQAKISGMLGAGQGFLTGSLSGGIVGGAIGTAAGGGPWGTIIGAAAGAIGGGVGSIVAMEKDLELLKQQQQEAKNYAIDRFNYSIANIKALPYTLTKVGAFTINSKIWPFIEYYTCTEKEKEAFRKKIEYDGMTVMRIEDLGNYLNNHGYLKADLIRNVDIIDDAHMLVDINSELNKGVYL